MPWLQTALIYQVSRPLHGQIMFHFGSCRHIVIYSAHYVTWSSTTYALRIIFISLWPIWTMCSEEWYKLQIQYIPRNMHTVFALLCFVVVIHWLIFPYPSGLLQWHCGNLTIAPVPAKQPWWIWINTSCEFIMNDCITTTKQSSTKPCAYFLGYTVCLHLFIMYCCPYMVKWWFIVHLAVFTTGS